MIKNLKENLHQESINNQKVQKFVPVLDVNLSVKIAPKPSAKQLKIKYAKSNKYKTFQ